MWHLPSDRQWRHKLTVQCLCKKSISLEVEQSLPTHQQIDLCLHRRNTWDIQSGQTAAYERCSGSQICAKSRQMSKPFKFHINFAAGRRRVWGSPGYFMCVLSLAPPDIFCTSHQTFLPVSGCNYLFFLFLHQQSLTISPYDPPARSSNF